MVPSLYQLCVQQVVANIERVESLCGLPEESCLECLLGVLQRGALNVSVVKLFTATGHDLVLQAIKVRGQESSIEPCVHICLCARWRTAFLVLLRSPDTPSAACVCRAWTSETLQSLWTTRPTPGWVQTKDFECLLLQPSSAVLCEED